jgi:hypothetical protein
VASNIKLSRENGQNEFLSPVRLPFRHTGNRLIAQPYFNFEKM